MKKLRLLSLTILIVFTTIAQAQTGNKIVELTPRFANDSIIINPDTLHFYFYGCSPNGERMSIINLTNDVLIIDRIYSESFSIECFENGENIAETGKIIGAGDTLEIHVFGYPYSNLSKDTYGTMTFVTDFGDYSVVLYHETSLGLEENMQNIGIFPNPANDRVTINGENLGNICIYNALNQKVDEFFTEDNTFILNTSKYKNGIYFIKVNGFTERLIINH